MRRLVPFIVLLAVITVATTVYNYIIYITKPRVWIPDPFNMYNITDHEISLVGVGNVTLPGVVAKLLDYGNVTTRFRIIEYSKCGNVTTALRLCGIAAPSGMLNITVCINDTCLTLLNDTTLRHGNTMLKVAEKVYVGHGYYAYLTKSGPVVGHGMGNMTYVLSLMYYTRITVYAVVCVDVNITAHEVPCNITLLFK